MPGGLTTQAMSSSSYTTCQRTVTLPNQTLCKLIFRSRQHTSCVPIFKAWSRVATDLQGGRVGGRSRLQLRAALRALLPLQRLAPVAQPAHAPKPVQMRLTQGQLALRCLMCKQQTALQACSMENGEFLRAARRTHVWLRRVVAPSSRMSPRRCAFLAAVMVGKCCGNSCCTACAAHAMPATLSWTVSLQCRPSCLLLNWSTLCCWQDHACMAVRAAMYEGRMQDTCSIAERFNTGRGQVPACGMGRGGWSSGYRAEATMTWSRLGPVRCSDVAPTAAACPKLLPCRWTSATSGAVTASATDSAA